jgi:outer membrane receptor for ferrienterochelin and colicins
LTRLHFILFFSFLLGSPLYGQETISGKIIDNFGKPVAYAHIIDLSTKNGVSADEGGRFVIQVNLSATLRLEISALGFKPERINLSASSTKGLSVVLKPLAQVIDEVVVTGTLYPMRLLDSPIKTQVITSALLNQIPSSSVVENLNFVNGVQEVINCGVCGTNDIHLNGMEGPYTLVLIDGMPIMSSLAAVYGLNGIPKSMVEQIEIIKGPASTQYGSEAMGGVINVVTKNPEGMPLLMAAHSASTHGEFNTDLGISGKTGERFNWLLSANHFQNTVRLDNNGDYFTDIPLSQRLSLFTKGNYSLRNGKDIKLSFRYYEESRFGGELNWNPEFSGSDSIYGEHIKTRRLEALGTIPLGSQWKVDWSLNRHKQESYYGNVSFNALQHVGFVNVIRGFQYKGHQILTGVSQKLNDYSDNTTVDYSGLEYTPGVFVQDLFTGWEKWDILSGLRADYHEAHGVVISPRLSIKRQLPHDLAIRLNTGTGFRVVNLFTEDHAALSGSRNIVVEEELEPERSFHTSLNLHGIFAFPSSYSTFDADGFYTRFSNKIIPDYDVDPNTIVYRNLEGHGTGYGLSAEYAQYLNNGLQFAVGATWMKNSVIELLENGDSMIEEQLFSPELSSKIRAGYSHKKWGLSIDYSALVIGPMKLPQYAPPNERNPYSPWYSLHHVQLTKELKDWKISLAVKNIFNYTQDSPLIRPDAPFSDQFDTSYAYGPLQTRRFVLMVAYTLQKKR